MTLEEQLNQLHRNTTMLSREVVTAILHHEQPKGVRVVELDLWHLGTLLDGLRDDVDELLQSALNARSMTST